MSIISTAEGHILADIFTITTSRNPKKYHRYFWSIGLRIWLWFNSLPSKSIAFQGGLYLFNSEKLACDDNNGRHMNEDFAFPVFAFDERLKKTVCTAKDYSP
jgi:hypothetical protein